MDIVEATSESSSINLTFGHSPDWAQLYQWAQTNNVSDALSNLLDVGLVAAAPATYRKQVVGSLLAVIKRPSSKHLFSKWSSHSLHAEGLYRLSEAISWDGDKLLHHEPCGFQERVEHYLKDKLRPLYVAGMCIARTPVPTLQIKSAEITWYETLVAWLIHSAHVANQEGYRQELYLHRVCERLRIASDHEQEQRILQLSKLALPFAECGVLLQFEHLLAYRAENILRTMDLDRIDEGLFNAIVKIARHQHAELALPGSPFTLPTRFCDSNTKPTQGVCYSPVTELTLSDDVSDEPIRVLQDESTSSTGIEIKVTKPTLPFQHLTGKSILVSSTEDLHFLPWTWNNLTEQERQWLSTLTNELLASGHFPDQLLGAIISIAELTARSLRRSLEICVSDAPQSEWTWQSDSDCLVREPRRRYSGWAPETSEESSWVRAAAQTQTLNLSKQVLDILNGALALAPSANCLGDLWASVTTLTPEVAFNKASASRCPRLTPGMLGRTLGASLLTTTRDAAFTKLAISHPKSALPGACAYGSWSSKQIRQAFKSAGMALAEDLSRTPDNDSAMGSLLAVIEDYLPEAFARSAERVKQLGKRFGADPAPNTADLISFHNAYVGYVVVQLLAATGARPVIDPFESPLDFNFASNFVYVEDKAHHDTPSGRLVPIPAQLASYIDSTYRHHLSSLALCVANNNPSLANGINELVADAHSHRLPFFFFLKTSGGTLCWDSVSEAGVEKLGLFDWPLPLNLFRHRLANQLRRLGVDVEIIDGLLGHGEAGAETYGDESWRTWQLDVQSASASIAQAFSELNTVFLEGLPVDFLTLPAASPEELVSQPESSAFGRSARASRRKLWLREAKADAIFHRRQLLAGRRLGELTPDELTDIGRQLLLNSKGMPHRRGWVKYGRFIAALERYGQIAKLRNRPSKYFLQHTTCTAFNEIAPSAAQSFPALRQLFHQAMTGIRPYSYQQAACYATIALCLESQIADYALLESVLRSKDYRVTKANSRHYIECGSDLHPTDADATVRRHRVSRECAKWLSHAQQRTTKAREAPPPLPEPLIPIGKAIESIVAEPIENCVQMIRSLAAITDQWNAMTLPGVVAGYLAGRNESWSLPLRSWVPLVSGRSPAFADVELADSDLRDDALSTIRKLSQSDENINVAAADAFYKIFRKAIRDYESGVAADEIQPDSETTQTAALPSRRNLQRALWRLIQSHSGRVSPTLLMLAKWVASFVMRKNQGRYVAVSSLFRYLTALSGPLTDIGFDTDIRVLDQDELTEFYGQLLSIGTQRRARYRFDRLRAFHRWCEIHHEVVRPDWAELPCSNIAIPADAGLILEADYLSALSALYTGEGYQNRESLGPALLLLLCYRFGLRPKEAIGIRRDEWLELGNEIQVIIQTNDIRRTKVPVASRRVVPLVFRLLPMERELLKRWFGALEAASGDIRNTPVFCDDAGQILDLDALSATARAALKRATGNPTTILYHARHTAGTAVAMALADIALPGAERLPAASSPDQRRHIQALLLGYPGVSRRSPWALARYFGHTGTDRARASYLHFFGDWADELVWPHAELDTARKALPGVFDVDQLPALDPIPSDVTAVVADYRFRPTLARVLQFLRLIGRGYGPSDAANRLSIPESLGDQWAGYLNDVDRRLYLEQEDLPPVDSLSRRFLDHIGESAWQRLLGAATSYADAQLAEFKRHENLGRQDVNLTGLSMIGATRQWTLWTTDQIALLRALLDFWNLPASYRRMVGPLEKIAGTQFADVARAHDLAIDSMRAGSGKKAIKIDAGLSLKREGKELHNFDKRCAFLFRENSEHAIRNSFEFLLACSATLMLGHSLNVERTL